MDQTGIIILCRFAVAAEKREAYLAVVDELVGKPTRQDTGCLQYEYTLPKGIDNEIVLIERWDSVENLKAHLAADYMKDNAALKAKYGVVSTPVRYSAAWQPM